MPKCFWMKKDEYQNQFRLTHIIESIDKIQKISSTVGDYDTFLDDWVSQDAVERNIQIIGEAVRHLDEDLKNEYQSINWKEIRGVRHHITHGYHKVDLKTVRDTMTIDIPLLKKQVEKMLKNVQSKDNHNDSAD